MWDSRFSATLLPKIFNYRLNLTDTDIFLKQMQILMLIDNDHFYTFASFNYGHRKSNPILAVFVFFWKTRDIYVHFFDILFNNTWIVVLSSNI